MRKIIFFIAIVLVVSCKKENGGNSVFSVVPFPNDVKINDGEFNAAGASVTYSADLDELTQNVIKAFAKKLSDISGKNSCVRLGDADSGFIFELDNQLQEEAYSLKVDEEMVLVRASGFRGFNYAIQTLKQLLPVEIFGSRRAYNVDWTIDCVEINDAPRFSYRGQHLDESRHFFGVEQVKRLLDIMEVHKLNKFHWHLTDDQGWRIEIKKYPLLTEVSSKRKGTCIKKDFSSCDDVPYGEGMWYTQEQIREIVQYAASKGIDVIPEIDLPGHMLGALAAYPELGCTGGPYEVWTRWGVSEDVLCAGNEKVYEFLEDVLTEVCDLFPYKYIHVGGDECPKVRWESCPKCQAKIKRLGLKDKDGQNAEHYLQSYVISRIEEFLNSKGRSIIGWDEILEGGIAPNATIMSWRGEAGGIEATRQGHDAIMTPNTYYYLDYYQSLDVQNEPFGIGGYLPVERCYCYEPFADSMSLQQTNHILGVQANLWTEYVKTPDHLFYMLLPRMTALSEVQWCKADRKDWGRFYAAADDFCAIYHQMGYNYADHILHVRGNVFADPSNRQVIVELTSQGDEPIRYTLDGTEPGRFSELYVKPIVIKESCELKAVSFRKGVEPRVFSRKFNFHQAVGKKVTYNPMPHYKYSAGAPSNLTDGIRGAQVYKTIEWTGWYGKPIDIIIDMEEETQFTNVTLGLHSNKDSFIFLPSEISIAVSSDGDEYVEVANSKYAIEDKGGTDYTTDLTLSFLNTSARYIKVALSPIAGMPQWHHSPGKSAYVFVDEIMVN